MANRVLYMTMLMLVIFQWLHKATSIHLKQSMAKTLFPDGKLAGQISGPSLPYLVQIIQAVEANARNLRHLMTRFFTSSLMCTSNTGTLVNTMYMKCSTLPSLGQSDFAHVSILSICSFFIADECSRSTPSALNLFLMNFMTSRMSPEVPGLPSHRCST